VDTVIRRMRDALRAGDRGTSARRTRWRWLVAPVLLSGVVAATVMGFYSWFDSESARVAEQSGLARAYPAVDNALKHAMAASSVYVAARKVGIPASLAESMTLNLGYANEWAERVLKPGPDSTLETMKDLNNNQVGIDTGEYMITHDHTDRMGLLSALLRAGVLLHSPEQINIEDAAKNRARRSQDVANAIAWFERSKGNIRAAVADVLNRETAARAAATPAGR
jgi:hypothetical protein